MSLFILRPGPKDWVAKYLAIQYIGHTTTCQAGEPRSLLSPRHGKLIYKRNGPIILPRLSTPSCRTCSIIGTLSSALTPSSQRNATGSDQKLPIELAPACCNFAWHMQDCCKMRWIRRLFLACDCPSQSCGPCPPSPRLGYEGRQLHPASGQRPATAAGCLKPPSYLT